MTHSEQSDELQLEVELARRHVDEHPSRPVLSPSGHTVVLVADDDPELRAYVRRCLRLDRHLVADVIEVADGVEAIAEMDRRPVRLVITDVVMPRMSGLELCRVIRHDPDRAATAVILVTGESSQRDADAKGREVGASAVIIKPFNARQLCSVVRRILRPESPAAPGSGQTLEDPTSRA